MTSRSDETGKAGEDERDETSESKKDFRAAAAPPYCLDGEQRRRHGQRQGSAEKRESRTVGCENVSVMVVVVALSLGTNDGRDEEEGNEATEASRHRSCHVLGSPNSSEGSASSKRV